MSEFKLCERAGLGIFKPFGEETRKFVVYAHEVEALLANAPVVYQRENVSKCWFPDEWESDTHTARLLLIIEPIVKESAKESAEDLLRELVEWKEWDGMSPKNAKPTLYEIKERARKLLDADKGRGT